MADGRSGGNGNWNGMVVRVLPRQRGKGTQMEVG